MQRAGARCLYARLRSDSVGRNRHGLLLAPLGATDRKKAAALDFLASGSYFRHRAARGNGSYHARRLLHSVSSSLTVAVNVCSRAIRISSCRQIRATARLHLILHCLKLVHAIHHLQCARYVGQSSSQLCPRARQKLERSYDCSSGAGAGIHGDRSRQRDLGDIAGTWRKDLGVPVLRFGVFCKD